MLGFFKRGESKDDWYNWCHGRRSNNIKNKLTQLSEISVAHVKFYTGILKDREVVITQSGIGKVNAAISTTLLINKFKPDIIINTGSAGALDESLNVGDVLISDDVKYHDADATAFGYEYGQVPQMPVAFQSSKPLIEKVSQVVQQQQLTAKVGLIVSGDSFIGSVEQRQKLKKHFQMRWRLKWKQLQLHKRVINLMYHLL